MKTGSDPDADFRLGEWWVRPAEGLLVGETERRHLRPKTMDVLCRLAKTPGRAVSKEALLGDVWSDTAVAEGALSNCISELRTALGDDSRAPRYVETIPRRGYRLVRGGERSVREVRQAAVSRDGPGGDGERQRPGGHASQGFRRPVLAALTVAFMTATLTVLWGRDRDPEDVRPWSAGPGAGLRTVVLELANLSGDPESDWLGEAWASWLSVELASTTVLSLVPREVLAELAAEIPQREVSSPSAVVSSRLRRGLGVDRVISGHYTLNGTGEAQVTITVTHGATGEVLTRVERRELADRPRDLVREAAHALRVELGWTETRAAGLRGYQRVDVTEAYFRGRRALSRFDVAGAREHFERAVREAPEAPWPRLALAEAWAFLGDRQRQDEELQASLELATYLAGEERLFFEAKAHALAETWGPAIERLRALWLVSPSSLEYGVRLAVSLLSAGRPDEALAVVDELAATLDGDETGGGVPGEPRLSLVRGEAALSQGRVEDALGAAEKAAQEASRVGSARMEGRARELEARAMRAAGETRGALLALEEAARRFGSAGDAPGEAGASALLASWWLELGEDVRAADASLRALVLSRRLGHRVGEAEALRLGGFLAWKHGRRDEGERALSEALEIFRGLDLRADEAHTLKTRAHALRYFDRQSPAAPLRAAAAIYRELGESGEAASLLLELGKERLLAGALPDALDVLGEGFELAGSLSPMERAHLHLFLGLGQRLAADLAASGSSLRSAIRQFGGLRAPLPLAGSLEQLAQTRLLAGDLPAACAYQWQSLELLEGLDAAARQVRARQGMARCLLEAGDLQTAESVARGAVEQARALQDAREIRAAAFDALALIELAAGRPRDALGTVGEIVAPGPGEWSLGELGRAVTRARVLAAVGERDRALEILATLAGRAGESGIHLLAFYVELARLDVLHASGEPVREEIEALARSARERGLTLIENKAEALLRTPGTGGRSPHGA